MPARSLACPRRRHCSTPRRQKALDEHIKVLAASDKRIVMMAMGQTKQQAEADAKLQVEAKAKQRAEADQVAQAAAESAAAEQAGRRGAVRAGAQPTAQLLSRECAHSGRA